MDNVLRQCTCLDLVELRNFSRKAYFDACMGRLRVEG